MALILMIGLNYWAFTMEPHYIPNIVVGDMLIGLFLVGNYGSRLSTVGRRNAFRFLLAVFLFEGLYLVTVGAQSPLTMFLLATGTLGMLLLILLCPKREVRY